MQKNHTKNSKKIESKKILCLVVALFALNLPNALNAKTSSKTLHLVMIGDALLHKYVYEDGRVRKEHQTSYQKDFAKDSLEFAKSKESSQTKQYKEGKSSEFDFDKMFEFVAPIFKRYDLAFYNQESILGGTELGLSSYPQFNSPKEFGTTMLNLGFNLISLANNHTLDKGEKGVRSMLRFWREQEAKNSKIYTAGSFESQEAREKIQQKILRKNGISYALLAYTYGTNGIPLPKGKEYLANIYTKEMLKSDIEAIRKKVDLLMVSIHWGVEYTHQPTSEQREIAQFLADLGVDIIIGNHPHAIQPIERIGDTLVFYALGNFISGQIGLQKRVGLIASVQIDKIKKKLTPKPYLQDVNTILHKPFTKRVNLHNVRADLVYTYYQQNPQDKKMSGFKIYPFYLLNDELLPNYQNIYDEYLQIIKQDWVNIGL